MGSYEQMRIERMPNHHGEIPTREEVLKSMTIHEIEAYIKRRLEDEARERRAEMLHNFTDDELKNELHKRGYNRVYKA
jgi:hypothetical protein